MLPSTPAGTPPRIPAEIGARLRPLAHDLSNSLEIITQAGYLLGQSPLDESGKRWAAQIDAATREAARINREFREILRTQSE